MPRSMMAKLTIVLTGLTFLLGGILLFNWNLTVHVQDAMQQVHTNTELARQKGSVFALKAKELQIHVIQVQQWLTDISATRASEGYDDGFDEAEKHAEAFAVLLLDFRDRYREENNTEGLTQVDNLNKNFAQYYETGKKLA